MNPMAIEAVQMTQDSLPTVAATAPIENSTSGGTPLATQNAPVQSMPRVRPPEACSAAAPEAVGFVCALLNGWPPVGPEGLSRRVRPRNMLTRGYHQSIIKRGRRGTRAILV